MADRGQPIRFIKGSYVGFNGCINTGKTAKSPMYQYVIVATDNGDKRTRVKKTSIRPLWQAPQSYEEAALQQYPEIELAMVRLAEMWASCGIDNNVIVTNLFNRELDNARSAALDAGPAFRSRSVQYDDE